MAASLVLPEGKAAARCVLRAARAALDVGERARSDAAICEAVVRSAGFAQAHVLLTYCSTAEEVGTKSIIAVALDQGKQVVLPRVAGPAAMEWYAVSSLQDLQRSPFGILEPDSALAQPYLPNSRSSQLALVPGLAFNTGGFRLGYGGGYYDRFLSAFEGCAWGLCREAFFFDGALPREPHDVPVAGVVTESGLHSPA
ncbi:MAG: 5-formyltetrahydrofolate cyclo-ligase [Coriobacteriia bacterium]|nr:5-formyltetrahydrofolate cyclo-ligase [Coriobacteriia bacterium]